MGSKFNFGYFPLLLWIFCTGLISSDLDAGKLQFEHITIADGLSHSKVNVIRQDRQGFMWFGTNVGLNRYDGYEISVYQHDRENPHSLSHNLIRDILEDSKGRLWIATDAGGLNLYQRDTDRFICFLHDPDDSASICSDNINVILEDKDHQLWIGTRHGLDRYDPDRNIFYHYLSISENDSAFNRFYIRALCFDNQQNLWIGTDNPGLLMLKPDRKTFIKFDQTPSFMKTLSQLNVMALYSDRQDNVWIGSYTKGVFQLDYKHRQLSHLSGKYNTNMNSVRSIVEVDTTEIWIGCIDGLYTFNRGNQSLSHYIHSETNPKSMTHQSVLCIYQNRMGHVWLGTRKGINYYNASINAFHHYIEVSEDGSSINNQVIFAFCEALNGDLWIGTETGGLNRLNLKTGRFSYLKHDPDDDNSLSVNFIKSLKMDHFGNLWIGTFSGGVNRLNRFENQVIRYLHDPKNQNSLANNDVYSIEEDENRNLWFATHQGVSVFNPETSQWTHFQYHSQDMNSLSNDDCKIVYRDHSGTIWIGTYCGLNRFIPETQNFIRYEHHEGDSTSLGSSYIQTIYEDSQNRFWVGTQGGGLNLFDRKSGKATVWRKKEELPSNSIYGILEDENGDLWCSSNRGIFKFNPQTEKIIAYDASDGLQSSQFNYNAFYKMSDGKLAFGGINGFNFFYPREIAQDRSIPPLAITDFKLYNQKVPVAVPGSPLKKHISQLDTLVLSHKQTFFTLEFAALDFTESHKNQYAYKLDGLENEWNMIGTQRSATYTNLNPGHYIFRLKGSNHHGIWNENPVSLVIIIKPPFYETLWFRIIASVLLAVIIAGIFNFRIRWMQKRNLELERIHQKLDQEAKESALAEKRIQNQLAEKDVLIKEIHHRVKNNLQIIISLLRLQSMNIPDDRMKTILLDSRERVRTMALVHERLYRAESLVDINFGEYIDNLIGELSNTYRIESRKIQFDIKCEPIPVQIDFAVPCGLVLNELLTNCLKHAFPDHWKGKPGLRIAFYKSGENILHLEVEDNGIGFHPDFDVKSSESLGLKLIHILVEDQLGGTVQIQSKKGVFFDVKIPQYNDSHDE